VPSHPEQKMTKCISGIRVSKILLGEDPDPPHGLRNFGARRVGLHTTWSAPQAKNPCYAPENKLAFLRRQNQGCAVATAPCHDAAVKLRLSKLYLRKYVQLFMRHEPCTSRVRCVLWGKTIN